MKQVGSPRGKKNKKMHTCYFCPFYQREWTWETITLQLGVSRAPADSTVVDNPKMRSQKRRGVGLSADFFLCFFFFCRPHYLKSRDACLRGETHSFARSPLHEDQLITTAERELVRKTHLPGDYLKEESSWAGRTLEKTSALAESGWGYSSLKCFSQSSLHSYSLPRFLPLCAVATHARTHDGCTSTHVHTPLFF